MNEVATIFKTADNKKLVYVPGAGTDEMPTVWQSSQMLVANLLDWGKSPEKEFCFGEQSKKVEVGDSFLETLALEKQEREEFLKEIAVARGAFARG